MRAAQRKERLYAPKHLSEQAKEEWRRLVAVLGDRYNKGDWSLYANYCERYAEVERLTLAVRAHGSTYTDHNGNPKTHPNAAQLSTAINQLAALCRDLNLTPRARMEKAKEAKSLNPIAAMRERNAARS